VAQQDRLVGGDVRSCRMDTVRQEAAVTECPEQLVELLQLPVGLRMDVDLVPLPVGLFCQAAGKQGQCTGLAVVQDIEVDLCPDVPDLSSR